MPQSRTKRSTRKLSEVARHVIIPSGIVTTGWPAVEARCTEWGDEFDEWQRGAGRIVLGKREGGEYAATVGGVTLSIPRQVAKTFLVGRIVFALCTLFPGLTVLWSAHRTRTATRTFNSLRGFAQRKAVAPYIAGIRATNGEQEITFTNGSVIMFGAREMGFGRGFDEVDIEVFDEAQILTEKALEDMIAATNQSRHPHGALLFYMGTPPRPIDPAEAFKARRRDALSGESEDAVYIECSADPDADPNDREQWAVANPSYPHRTPLRSMLRLRKNLPSPESWKREALGIWDSDQEGSRLIPADTWRDTGIETAPTEGVKVFGVAFSLDGSRLAVAGGLKHSDGVHVELVDAKDGFDGSMEEGLAPLADWLATRWRDTAAIVLSGMAGAPVLAKLLKDRHVPDRRVKILTSTQYFESCAMLLDSLREGSVTHLSSQGQAALDDSVAVCDKKIRVRSGQWGWVSTIPAGDETPIEAISLALWGARTARRSTGKAVFV